MSTRDAALALRRFGLGARPGDVARIGGEGRGFVLAQLDGPPVVVVGTDLKDSASILGEVQKAQRELRDARKEAKSRIAADANAARTKAVAQGPAPAPDGKEAASIPAAGKKAPDGKTPIEPRPARLLREAFVADVEARIVHSVTTDAPLVERLVLFWSSHFSVSAAKGPVRGLAGAFEREVIRPHVLGRFGDMLKAVAQHPAMLIYLDNAQSIGPASEVGKRRARGLNENLAREILELHTLGVAGGYTQADVTSLAKLLTGWTVGQVELAQTVPGRFFFAGPRHEPGGATVLGKRYAHGGLAEGEAALADLARHPSTARHVAGKLARHFVADVPPPALTAALEKAFRETDGDLKAVVRTLVTAPEAWAAAPAKVVPPYDYLVSLARGFAGLEPPLQVHRLAGALGQPTWAPPSPKGWPDEDDAWTSPAAIRERLRIAEVAARKVAGVADPRELAHDLLGGLLGSATQEAIARAETKEQGLELLAMSPEFLRR